MMPSEIAGIDATTGRKEAEISKLAALSGRYEIVLSNLKNDLPNFHLSDTLYASSSGGTARIGIRSPFFASLPPSRWDKRLDCQIQISR